MTGNKAIPPLLLPVKENIVITVLTLYGYNVPSQKKAENMVRLTAPPNLF